MTAVHLGATVLGLSVLVGALAPRRRIRVARPADLCAALLAFAGLAMALALAGAALALWPIVTAGLALGVSSLLLSVVIARAAGDDDDEDDGGGGGGGPPRHDPDPPPPVAPDGQPIDWSEFDAQRSRWGSPGDRVGL